MMSYEVLCFIFALLASIALIFLVIWNVIAFDDLRTDYKNPIDLCQTLNPLVLPEYGLHAFLMLLFFFGGFWIVFLFNVPLLCYNIYRYANRGIISGVGIYDPTEIMSTSVLNKCQREGWVKLAFFLISFFVYLYRLLYALLS
ncbi:protein cornichon homolog 1-like [Rhopilema esculentum]|uniref:protein cornichon homolog 1-like n=1 Tax=Rhopilema esculentum TaxID=499914 RepID=UPI0031D1B98A